MSYNGSGTFTINSTGQPVVAGTVISSSAFNALTTDLATGLTTAITKDGQTTTTARITFAQGFTSSLVTDSSSISTGSIITGGGVGIAKALYVGTTANVAGAVTLGGIATFSAQPIFSSLTASSAVATDASKGLVSVTNTGTGNNVLATSPTITTPTISSLSSASATALTLQSAGSTAITVNTSQNVGIGTTSPTGRLQVSGTMPSISGGNGQLQVFSTDSLAADKGGKIALGGVSGEGGSFDPYGFAYVAGLKENATSSNFAGYLSFGSSTSGGSVAERMRIDSSGRVLVGLTSANTSGANFQVSQGITFPATQSASSDANTLDDYEEGTWTPAGGSLTNNTTATYTKIGRFVYVNFDVTFPGGGAATQAQISGLPFTSLTPGGGGSIGITGYTTPITLNVERSNTFIVFATFGNAAILYSDLNGLRFIATATYLV